MKSFALPASKGAGFCGISFEFPAFTLRLKAWVFRRIQNHIFLIYQHLKVLVCWKMGSR
jgi:hypothetical protein